MQSDESFGYLRLTITSCWMISRTELKSVVEDIRFIWSTASTTCIRRTNGSDNHDVNLAAASPLGPPAGSLEGDDPREPAAETQAAAATCNAGKTDG